MLLTLGSEYEKEHEQAISQVDFAPCPAILHQGGGKRDRGGIRKNIYTTYGVLEQMKGSPVIDMAAELLGYTQRYLVKLIIAPIRELGTGNWVSLSMRP